MLYANYLAEAQGREYLETDDGFITYKIVGEYVHIDILYVKPDRRIQGKGSAITLEMFKRLPPSVHTAVCEIDIASPCCNEALRAVTGFGFRILDTTDKYLRLYYQIKEQ